MTSFESDELRSNRREAIVMSIGPSIFDGDSAFDPIKLPQPLDTSSYPLGRSQTRGRSQEPDGRQQFDDENSLRSTGSSFRGSITHPTQALCTLRVRRHHRLTQHSLPGG